jgi:hypothetical protein
MTKDWVKMGEDLGVGLVAGAADQFVQNKDDDRAKAKSTETPVGELAMQSQYSTYLNFGLPILDVVAVAMGWLKGEWATRMTTVSGQLVGRKLVHKFSSEKHLKGYPGSDNSVGYSASSGYERARELEARRQKEITVIPGRTVSVMEI